MSTQSAKKGSTPGAMKSANDELTDRKVGRGRPSKEMLAAQRIAIDKMADYILDRVKPVLDTYVALAIGRSTGKKRRKLDPATTRHLVERFLPPAAKTVNIGLPKSIEDFYNEYEEEMKAEAAKKVATKLITDEVTDAEVSEEPDGEETRH